MADTPEKNQFATPISSKCEDSPVFNFINSLSPIEPVKSINITQTFNAQPFASPTLVFTSPQIISQREARFFKRNHFINLSRPDFSESGIEDRKNYEVSDSVELPDSCTNDLGCFTPGNSTGEILANTWNDHSKFVAVFPKSFKCECSSPDRSMLACNVPRGETMLEIDGTQASLSRSMSVGSIKRYCSSENEMDLSKICQIEQNNEASACDWEKLIIDTADLLCFNSSIIENSERQDNETFDSAMSSYVPTATQLPKDHTDDLQRNQAIVPDVSCEKDHIKLQLAQSGEVAKMEADQLPKIPSNTGCKQIISDLNAEVGGKDKKEINAIFKPGLQQHRSIRRLVFEMSRVQKNRLMDNHSNSSFSSPECKVASNEKKVSIDLANGCSSSRLPGIGLHLNALASTSNNVTVPENDNPVFVGQLVNLSGLHSSFGSLISGQKPLGISLDSNSKERGSGPCDNGIQGEEDATSSFAMAKDVKQCSPKKKRHKSEQAVESNTCKRCNCKKSKCLKLYCECFAAGLYCVEPCSCQDCFNKPSHADTVLQTRKQIESRNPLAFAPKVIRSFEFVQEFRDDTKNTPASARHKRGCNCKKSSCLKKYCECFQGGVGCSISCRCEGCKNSFGRKYGIGEMELEEEEAEEYEQAALVVTSQKNLAQNGEHEQTDPAIPVTPSLDIGSKPPSMPHLADGPSPPFCSKENLEKSDFECHFSKSDKHLQVIPEDETHTLEGNCSPTNRVKSMSPNSKRVSPPQHKFASSRTWLSGRKLILRSIPSFPSLTRHETSKDSGNHD